MFWVLFVRPASEALPASENDAGGNATAMEAGTTTWPCERFLVNSGGCWFRVRGFHYVCDGVFVCVVHSIGFKSWAIVNRRNFPRCLVSNSIYIFGDKELSCCSMIWSLLSRTSCARFFAYRLSTFQHPCKIQCLKWTLNLRFIKRLVYCSVIWLSKRLQGWGGLIG